MNTIKEITTVDEYIASFPQEEQVRLQELRSIIKEMIPEAQEVISYKMPTYTIHDRYVVYFAGWKNHISLYPFSTEMEKEIKGTSEYDTSGKGTIQFPNDKPLPKDIIKEIISFLLKNNKTTA